MTNENDNPETTFTTAALALIEKYRDAVATQAPQVYRQAVEMVRGGDRLALTLLLDAFGEVEIELGVQSADGERRELASTKMLRADFNNQPKAH